MGSQLPLKGAQPPVFGPVYCGQTSRWTKTPLATEVDLGPVHIVLDPAPPVKGAQHSLFAAHVYCGHGRPSQLQLSSCTNGRPKTVRPILSDRYPVCPVVTSLDVGVLWPNGWMDQDETWHGGRPRPRHSPQFLAHVCCGQTAPWIKMPL